MEADAECLLCRKGRVTRRVEQLAFKQSSDKGYVHCQVTIMVGTCDKCQTRFVDQGADRIFDEAFQRAYEKMQRQQTDGDAAKQPTAMGSS
jgi:hypothetical protein